MGMLAEVADLGPSHILQSSLVNRPQSLTDSAILFLATIVEGPAVPRSITLATAPENQIVPPPHQHLEAGAGGLLDVVNWRPGLKFIIVIIILSKKCLEFSAI